MSNTSPESQPTDFPDTPRGWASRWQTEIEVARKALEDWRNLGDEIDKAFRDERDGLANFSKKRNLFSANIILQEAMLYGNTPKTDVDRRFADPRDDVARVAGELLERILNTDVEKSGDTSEEAFGDALNDRLLPGLGVVRGRYAVEMEEVPGAEAVLREGVEVAPAVPPSSRKKHEDACIDYVHWRDFLWGKSRVWGEVPWVAFGVEMTRDKLKERFGEDIGKAVPLNSSKERMEDREKDPYARAYVLEIWHKESKKVFWYVEGHPVVLDMKEDPLQLEGFWPCPKPMVANRTTSKLVPRPDYILNKDTYSNINELVQRIDMLVSAVRAAGAYDNTAPALKQLLNGKKSNILVPVENWALFAEKGGLKGAIDWMPLDQVIASIQVLRNELREEIDALFQDSGFSDIMRGQATQAGATATEQRAKVRFGSARMQRMQEEFARFVTDAHRIKAEIVCKHWDVETILERSNAKFGYENPQLVMQAVQLLKSEYACYRIQVKPEAIALSDAAEIRGERTEVIDAVATYMQRMAPLLPMLGPTGLPFVIELLQAGVAGLKGASTMEAILDRAVEAAKQAQQQQQAAGPQQAPPDPKVQAQQLKMQGDQMKAQADIQKQQLKHQQDMERIAAETQAHDQQEQSQAQWNVREAAQKQMVSNALRPHPIAPAVKPGGLP